MVQSPMRRSPAELPGYRARFFAGQPSSQPGGANPSATSSTGLRAIASAATARRSTVGIRTGDLGVTVGHALKLVSRPDLLRELLEHPLPLPRLALSSLVNLLRALSR